MFGREAVVGLLTALATRVSCRGDHAYSILELRGTSLKGFAMINQRRAVPPGAGPRKHLVLGAVSQPLPWGQSPATLSRVLPGRSGYGTGYPATAG